MPPAEQMKFRFATRFREDVGCPPRIQTCPTRLRTTSSVFVQLGREHDQSRIQMMVAHAEFRLRASSQIRIRNQASCQIKKSPFTPAEIINLVRSVQRVRELQSRAVF